MEIAVSIMAKVAEYFVEPTSNQVRYFFCPKSIVEDLKREETALKSARDGMEGKVERARQNTEIIEKDVENWLADVSTILTEVETLKEELEVNNTCFNRWYPNCVGRYALHRKAAKKTRGMIELKEISGNFESVGHPASLPGIEFSAPKDFVLFQSSKIAFGQIMDALRDIKTNLVGLYAMGGAGKTMLATTVGLKVKEEGTFHEVVTVVASQTPNFKDIQGNLAAQLGMQKLEEEGEEERAKRLSLRFKDSKKKILVILDDVWKKFDLKSKLGIPIDEDQKNFAVLLTTRKKDVCISLGCQFPIQLNLLTEKEGLDLLKSHADIVGDAVTLNDVAEEIVKECKGLPLAIVTIGSALKGKGVDEWKLVSRKLKSSKLVDVHNAFDVDKDVYAVLKLSYDYLNGEETKFCFLLCSLFPEDYRIPLEELVLYGMGRGGLFSDANSIEEARSQLRVTLNNLKACCLLLDAGCDCVKMHDMVRDVALWIASEGENVFMSKAGMTLSDWSREKGWERYTAISSVDNQIVKVPLVVVCPKLEILILSGIWGKKKLEVSNEFFTGMKGLKVLSLSCMSLSIKSLQFLTNLKTLVLKNCDLKDVSFLGKLTRLEFLRLGRCTSFDELPELGQLRELRFLDFELFGSVTTIHSNVIKRFSQLEELYLRDENILCEVERTSVERRHGRLFELNSLTCLNVLFLCIRDEFIPKDFAFPKLPRYSICVNCNYFELEIYDRQSYARALNLFNIDASLFIAFKALYETLEDLFLKGTRGCQNIIPSIDQGGLNKLESLDLRMCDELEYVLDMTRAQQPMPSKAFSKLVKLFLSDLKKLREICYGESLPREFLEKLETVRVYNCPDMCRLFPTILLLRLHELKEVKISYCDRLQEVFQLEGLCPPGDENHVLLPNLAMIELIELKELKCLWKGPTNHVNLRSLTCLYMWSCRTLEYVLPINIARSLVQLERLRIVNAPELKQLFFLDHGSEENVAVEDGEEIVLPKLREVTLEILTNLITFYPENYYSTWPALEVLRICYCPNLMSMVVDSIQKNRKEKLRVLEMVDCMPQLSNGILACLKDGSKNLEELFIRNDRVGMAFKVDRLVTSISGEQHLSSFSSLKDLKLEPLEELEGLYKDFMHILTLQNLTELYITGHAHKSIHLFSLPLAQNLLLLKRLEIKNCKELEQIIFEGDKEDQNFLKESTIFPNLKSINVQGCHKLKHLIPITIVRGFQLLEGIIVVDNFELEEVFGHSEGDIMDDKEIRMHKLKTLRLKELPSLTNFCSADYHFIFSSFLLSLVVEGCPKITTRFSVIKDKSLHAEAKAPSNESKNDIISYYDHESEARRAAEQFRMAAERFRTFATIHGEEKDNGNEA